jgi:3-hydroxymyristoyl/3-hydroxydecanoyl-(acyl carrier protein) dehydratase
MRPAPFHASWQMEPVGAGSYQARLVLADESLFAGHYPGAPILPGTFLVEALVQAARAALGGEPRLLEIIAARFHSPLRPGDEVAAHFTIREASAGATLVEATASARAKAADVALLLAPDGAPAPPAAAASWPPAAGPDARLLDLPFIERALPHRAPLLLVDRALVGEAPGRQATLVARKRVTTSEPGWAGVPKAAGYPEILVAESFCQACGLLRAATAAAAEPRDDRRVPVVAKLAGLRFLGDVAPGDELAHHVQLVVRTGEGAVFSGQTWVAGRPVLEVARVVAALAPPARPSSPAAAGVVLH